MKNDDFNIGDTFIWKVFKNEYMKCDQIDAIHYCFVSSILELERIITMNAYSFLENSNLVVYGRITFSVYEHELIKSRVILFEKTIKKEMVLKDNRGNLDKILDRNRIL